MTGQLSRRRLAIFGLTAISLFGAWRYFAPGLRQSDFNQSLDRQVDTSLGRNPQVDAIEFLESGGVYADKNPTAQGMDRAVVLPFMKRLRDLTGTSARLIVMADEPKIATGAVHPLPARPEQLRALKAFMQREEAAFEGVIIRQYGDKWLYFDFIDQSTAKQLSMKDWDAE